MLQKSIEFYLDLRHRRNHFQLRQISERLQKAFRRVDVAVPAELEPLVHAEIHSRCPVDHVAHEGEDPANISQFVVDKAMLSPKLSPCLLVPIALCEI